MTLQFLGAGSAFTQDNRQSNMVLTKGDKRLLIDAGSDVRCSLKEAGLHLRMLDGVYISHLHSDHCGGMEYLALATYFDPAFINADGTRRRLKLYLHSSIEVKLWEMLQNGCVVPGIDATLETFFEVVSEELAFVWNGIEFTMVKTVHCHANQIPIPCYGIAWYTDCGRVWLSGDTIFEPEHFANLFATVARFSTIVKQLFPPLCTRTTINWLPLMRRSKAKSSCITTMMARRKIVWPTASPAG